jgi:hypothetical protein
MGEQIKVMINRDGTLTLNVKDSSGARCLTLTASFEQEIGHVLDRQRTSDFYKSGQLRNRNLTRTSRGN